MNKWLVGLIVVAVGLPLLMFVGNLKFEVPEAGKGGTDSGSKAVTAYPKAPELAGISAWINSEPLKISDLKGKVVLVDFWTYSCINCIRTLPYLNSWQEKYSDKGLAIIGVHSPEFDFEKDLSNVRKAVEKYGIKYPVALDNDHATWSAFRNNYWPHKYLIDINGKIRYDHIGEGGYDKTEQAIQELLKERAGKMRQKVAIPEEASSPEKVVGVNFTSIATPEIYLGYQFARSNIGNDEGLQPEAVVAYTAPSKSSYGELVPSMVYVGGTWKNNPDSLELVSDEGRVVLKYTARAVNIVAGSSQQPALLQAILDGNFVNSTNSGSDVKKSLATVDEQRLYNLVMDDGYHTKTIEVNVRGKGFRLYTFTFG